MQRYFKEQNIIEIIKPIEIPKYIRINSLKADESILDSLFNLVFQFSKVPEIKNTYQVLESAERIFDTIPYREGMLILQDWRLSDYTRIYMDAKDSS